MFAVAHFATLIQNLLGTFNPSDKGANITLSNGNLSMTSAGLGSTRSTTSRSSGLYYVEYLIDTPGVGVLGVGDSGASVTSYPGGSTNSIGTSFNAGVNKNAVGQTASGIGSWVAGDTIGQKLDLTGNTISWNRNNGAFSATYALPTTGIAWFLMAGAAGATASGITLKATPTYSVPSGYTYWGS